MVEQDAKEFMPIPGMGVFDRLRRDRRERRTVVPDNGHHVFSKNRCVFRREESNATGPRRRFMCVRKICQQHGFPCRHEFRNRKPPRLNAGRENQAGRQAVVLVEFFLGHKTMEINGRYMPPLFLQPRRITVFATVDRDDDFASSRAQFLLQKRGCLTNRLEILVAIRRGRKEKQRNAFFFNFRRDGDGLEMRGSDDDPFRRKMQQGGQSLPEPVLLDNQVPVPVDADPVGEPGQVRKQRDFRIHPEIPAMHFQERERSMAVNGLPFCTDPRRRIMQRQP